MKRLGLFALSLVLLAIPTSSVARGGHGHGGHGSHRHHHHGHHFHGHGGIVRLPFFWLNDGPVYYYDRLAVYPPSATIYDPQTGMVWMPAHWSASATV
jgi:hypothetical protein